MAKVKGRKEVMFKFGRIAGPEMVYQLGAALFAGGQLIENEAAYSITTGSVSGKGHVPSKAGEAPNSDTHLLDRSIGTILVNPLRAEVISDAPYSVALEFGTSKMAERPFMRPAVAKRRKEAVQLVRDAASKIIRGGKVIP